MTNPLHDALFAPLSGRHGPLLILQDGATLPGDAFLRLLARVDAETGKVKGPSIYSEMVWNARQLRAQAGLKPIDWIVLRNRLGAQQMHNKKKVGQALEDLSKRIGFRVAPGFSERVIFRELFPRGLTLLDLKDTGVDQLNISNIAARQEVRDLIKELRLPKVTLNF